MAQISHYFERLSPILYNILIIPIQKQKNTPNFKYDLVIQKGHIHTFYTTVHTNVAKLILVREEVHDIGYYVAHDEIE